MRRHIVHTPTDRLSSIESASRTELNALFEAEFGGVPAPRASLEFMRQNLAWAAQARADQQNPRKQREKLIRALTRGQNGGKRGDSPYRPGTRLVREWRGKVYEVTVMDKGYAWEGRPYPNLSRIATEITGTKWSGPRFFGLKGGTHGQR
jgi:hypothetical protein